MNEPVPDGRLELYFAVGNGNSREFKFADIKRWSHDYASVHVSTKTGFHIFPLANLIEVRVVSNSDAYCELLDRYQKQHEHEWEPGGEDCEGLVWVLCDCGASRPMSDPQDIHYNSAPRR